MLAAKTSAATGPKPTKGRDPRRVLLDNAKGRARSQGLPFTITLDDVVIPTHCPILGIPIYPMVGNKGGGAHSPSIDRIVGERGYVPGNIVIISNRANRLKSDATIEELRSIASFYATLRAGVRVTGAQETA